MMYPCSVVVSKMGRRLLRLASRKFQELDEMKLSMAIRFTDLLPSMRNFKAMEGVKPGEAS